MEVKTRSRPRRITDLPVSQPTLDWSQVEHQPFAGVTHDVLLAVDANDATSANLTVSDYGNQTSYFNAAQIHNT